MKIIYNLTEPIDATAPVILTIGNFDGVHHGHQLVLNRVLQIAHAERRKSAVITFSNHPSEVLRPGQPVRRLCTIPHKIRLLEQAGIDILIMPPFTKEFSQQTAGEFLQRVRAVLPFSHLILGYDATIGRDKEGDRMQVQQLAEMLKFQLEYLESWMSEGIPVSSTAIRAAIQKGDLAHAEKLLGRKYSIYGPAIRSPKRKSPQGYSTIQIDVTGLCLPPEGDYVVSGIVGGRVLEGTATLGVASATDNKPTLEIVLFATDESLYDQLEAGIEVVFEK